MKVLVTLALCIAVVLAGDAPPCDADKCNNDKCRCSSTVKPEINGNPDETIPQLVSLTFNEAIVARYFDRIWKELLDGRTNNDTSIVSATFFVPHEYTDYSLVQELFNMGHEIGVHSVTKSHEQEYWRTKDVTILTEEFGDQRKIINSFARIPIAEIRGARAPQLQFNGDVTFQAYVAAGLVYENSWPTPPKERLFPYTLDYASTEKCEATEQCPKQSFPGFWVNPIIDLSGNKGKYCHEIFGCDKNGTAQEIADWLMEQVMTSYDDTRAPVTLLADAGWFDDVENSLDGMKIFLNNLSQMKDTYLVSQYDIVKYMQKPVAAKDYKPTSKVHKLKCLQPKSCTYQKDGQPRTMVACVPCPKNYPWIGNPSGN